MTKTLPDPVKLLDQLEAQVRAAREALADEHEGNFRRAANLIAYDADELATLVASW